MKISTHSNYKSRWWRTCLIVGLIFTIGIIIFGCEKDEYYIKYWVRLDTRQIGWELNITYKNEKNETITLSETDGWGLTIGPVDEGFNASLSAATLREIGAILQANIQVSKNDGPFVIKASAENDTSEPLQIDYTIDF